MKCCAEWQTHKSSHLDKFPYRLIYKMKIVCESHVSAAVSLLSFWFVSPHLVWLKLIRSVYFHSFCFCFCFCFILHALPANISQHIGMYVLFSIFIPTHGHKIIGYSAQKPSRTKFLNVRNSKLQHQTVFLMYTCTHETSWNWCLYVLKSVHVSLFLICGPITTSIPVEAEQHKHSTSSWDAHCDTAAR